jgi:hypothetical protein
MSFRRTSRNVVLGAAAWVVAGATVLAVAGQTIQVTPLARAGRVMVSFRLSDGFPVDVTDAIHSGLTTTFAYDVKIKRSAAVWFDRTVAAANVSASVKYDTLTRTFSVSRSDDGRMDADSTETEDVVHDFLTKFDRLPLFSRAGPEPNVEYYLRVRAQTTPHTSWALWSLWDRHDVAGVAKFTFMA